MEKLFFEFGADGKLTADRYDAMGGIGGSIDRALAEAQRKAADERRRGQSPPSYHPRSCNMGPGSKRGQAPSRKGSRVDAAETVRSLPLLANALVEARLLTRSREHAGGRARGAC